MISVVVCTYNRAQYLPECLRRLAANKTTAAWELLLIDNNSTDQTPLIARQFAEQCKGNKAYMGGMEKGESAGNGDSFVSKDYAGAGLCAFRYVLEKQQGLSYARNRGIQEARGEWIVFLDDDAFVEADYMENLAQHLSKHPQIGAFGGKIVPLFEAGEPQWYSRWSRGFVSALDKGDRVCEFQKSEFPVGANMGIRRDVLAAVGDFNTALGRTASNLLAGEEKDLFSRIRQRGYEIVYFPDITVQHCIPPHRTTTEFIRRLGYGVGQSERLRTRANNTYALRLVMEAVKWCATVVLWVYYALQRKRDKGNILWQFRREVTRGLIGS